MSKGKISPLNSHGTITLRAVAEHVGLAPGTVSAVLNNAPSARSIPEHTRQRIHAAAKELKYRPNFLARSLRKQRTYTVGLILEEIGDSYGSMIISGVEAYLREKNYFFLTVIHRHDATMLRDYSQLLLERGVEGFVTVDTSFQEAPPLPTVCVAGHRALKGVTNIILDQEQGIRMGPEHLVRLGHRKIAFIRGPKTLGDSAPRWQGVRSFAKSVALELDPRLIVDLPESGDPISSFEAGYKLTEELIKSKRSVTALMAFDDMTAFGAIRALAKAGLRVPEHCSVIGFDDVAACSLYTPPLTTIRQPMEAMGAMAANLAIERINAVLEKREIAAVHRKMAPELAVRESTRSLL